MTLHYTLSFLLLFVTALSTLRFPKWWIKMWDAARLQLIVLMILLLIIGLFHFDFQLDISIAITVLLLSGIIYHAYIIFPFTPFHKPEVTSTTKANNSLRMITCNVRTKNKDYPRLIQLLHKYQPDLVLLTEVDHKWVEALAVLKKNYSYHLEFPLENTYGIALYSKVPLIKEQVKFLVENDIPSIHTELKLNGKTIQFIGLHPRPPAPWTEEENKDLEIIRAAALTNHNMQPSIVTGDLNDVCWSKITQAFKAISALKDPRVGRGFFNTYNALIPFFRYPVDHFFLSPHFKVRKIKRLEKVGSDHFPVLLEVNLEA